MLLPPRGQTQSLVNMVVTTTTTTTTTAATTTTMDKELKSTTEYRELS